MQKPAGKDKTSDNEIPCDVANPGMNKLNTWNYCKEEMYK